MNVPRFSLRTLLAAMAYLAIVLAVIGTGSLGWANVVCSITLAALFIATLAAVFSSHSHRTFWRGFSLTAWLYVFLALVPNAENGFRDRLLTHQILSVAYRQVVGAMWANRSGMIVYFEPERATSPGDFFYPHWQAFAHTGHCVWTIVLGLIGGYLAVYFSRRSGNHSPTT